MQDESTTPAQPPQPRPRRVDRKALRRLREPIRPQNIAKRPHVYCWDCRRANEAQRGDTCSLHASRWCSTCRSYISNAHDHEDYVGHPEVTDRFLDADLQWNWRPMALDVRGLPQYDDDGGMWIYLTIGGVERLAYGKPGPGGVSELISNSLKNGGIRFGTALNQRAQTDLHAPDIDSASRACPHCETTCDPDARFCSNCGHQLPEVETGDRVCSRCETSCAASAKYCSGCGHLLLAVTATGSAPPAEPEYARPDWIARVNSLLARKRGIHGQDRLNELSLILKRDVTDAATLSPAEAQDVVRILSGKPDLTAPAPAAKPESGPEPVAGPSAEEPPAEPAPAAVPPQPSPRRAAPTGRTAKTSKSRPDVAPVAPGPGAAHVRTINSLLNSRGVPVDDTPARMRIISAALGRTIESLNELTPDDAVALIPGLGSGVVSVDPQPAAAPATADGPESGPGIVDELLAQINQAITDEDAAGIKVQIGKALMSELIAKGDAATLINRLEERGRQVGLAGAS